MLQEALRELGAVADPATPHTRGASELINNSVSGLGSDYTFTSTVQSPARESVLRPILIKARDEENSGQRGSA